MSVGSRDLQVQKAKDLLNDGFVPGIVYGHGIENVAVQISARDFSKIFNEAGESSLLSLKIDGKDFGNVIIHDYQCDPLTGDFIHFDLHKVRMDEKITAHIDVVLNGESPAVKDLGGILVVGHDSIEIKCLPSDLIHEVEVDISVLKTFDDMIRVKDLLISDVIEVLSEEDDVLVSVEPPRSEAEMEELNEKVEENIDKVEGAVKEEAVVEAGKEA